MNIQTSILDRLLDDEPGVSREAVQHQLADIREIKQSVIRDMESLLNTRRKIFPVPDEFKEVNNSLFVYGLPDFSSQNPKNPQVKQMLRRDIEQTIAKFERRLMNVKVKLEMSDKMEQKIRFRITGILHMEPFSEPVTFDTQFDINKGNYAIAR
ncbi:MAG: type VI secretion system baseplate subunit TssE [Syntrophaceae bacterium]